MADKVNCDYPPFSRVFVVCSKGHKEEEIRAAFEPYGTVEDVWMVKDRMTKEAKGICYVKFDKASSAALAIEGQDGKIIGDEPKPIKAMIASSKNSHIKTDYNDESSRTRLFVVCPKEYSSDDLKAKFEQFGDLEYCNIIRDKQTGESKGFGYVKFSRASTAAVAMENCDKSLKAILAEPKSAKFARDAATAAMQREQRQMVTDPAIFGATSPTHNIGNEFLMSQAYETGMSNRLVVLVSSTVTQEQIVRLFDLMPGMEFCDLKLHQSGGEAYGIAYITFNSIPAAIYAKDKLNGFEYPPGSKLVVKFMDDQSPRFGPPSPTEPLYPFHSAPLSPMRSPVRSPVRSLSPVRPLTTRQRRNSFGSDFDGRVFFICNPQPPADHVLREIFGRFGTLTDLWVVRGKNYGYAKFMARASAEAAITALHGMEVFGVRLKVMLADPPPEDGRSKR